MSPEKFATLLRAANAGRLPAKFIVDAGGGKGPEAKAFDYRKRSGIRVKAWDNHAFRVLPVTNFVMILPMDLATTATQFSSVAGCSVCLSPRSTRRRFRRRSR
jgi:hypothetical protein